MANGTDFDSVYVFRVTPEQRAPRFLLFIFGVCTTAGILRSTRLKAKMMSPILDLVLFFVGVGYGFLTEVDNFPVELNFIDVYELGPFTLMCIWFPLLLCEAVFAMDARTFASLFLQVVFLGSLGFTLIVAMRTLFVYYAFKLWYNWPVWTCVIYASVTSLTDPTLILKLFKEIGSYKTLCRLLEGEAFIMLAAACCSASYMINFHLVNEADTTVWNHTGNRVLFFFAQIFAAPVYGYFIGRVTVSWLTQILNDPAIEIILVISIGYLTFLVASILNMSSVLAVLTYMLVLSDRRVCLYLGNDSYLQRMFDILKLIASASIYVLAGIQLTRQKARLWTIDAADVLMTLTLYFQYIFARGILAMLLLPFLHFGGYHMTLPEGASVVWCATHRATTLLLGMVCCHSVLAKPDVNVDDPHEIFKLYFHICGLFVLTCFINGATTTIALDFFGMRRVPLSKRITMAGAIQLLREVIQSTLKTYRADRFLADADWDIVYKHVYLEIPYKSGYVSESNLEELIEGVKPVARKRRTLHKREKESCQTDFQEVPKAFDSQDEVKEARLKVFRAKKASFWKQYQHGMLSLEAVRALVESIDYARDDSEHIQNIEKMMKYCQVKGIFKQTSFVKRKFEEMESSVKQLYTITMEEIKENRIRKFFFTIHNNEFMKLFINVVLLANFFVVLIGIILMWNCTINQNIKKYDLWLDIVNYVVISLYSFMVLCKLLAFGKHYFMVILNYIELIILVISYVELVLRETVFSKRRITSDEELFCYVGPVYVTMNAGYRKLLVISTVLLSTRFLRTFRLFEIGSTSEEWRMQIYDYKLVRSLLSSVLIQMHSKRLISFINEQLQLRLKLGYDIGKGYVTCVEEVHEMLDNMIENKEIRDRYKEQMTFLRLSRMKELATLQKTYPGIVLSVKSQHAGRRILNNLNDRISQMRRDGMLDEKESDMLEQMIAARLKLLLKIPPDIPLPAPGKVLSEITWVAGNRDFIEYIQNNAKLIGMAEGEVLDADSNPYGGLYIIISGLVRVDMYLHEPANMPGKARPTLTAVAAAAAAKEQEKCSDYLTTGSTLGEMSLLTTVAHKTIATCETTVQLYHFEYEAVQAALELYVNHPSLEHQLWYACSLHVSYALMKKRLPYRTMPTEDLKLVIENGILFVNPWIVPDGGKFQEDGIKIDLRPLSRYEIIVVYGTASTLDGFETFRGPCVIPVGVEHLWFQPHDTDKYVIYVVPRDALVLGSHLSPGEFGGSSYGDKDDASRLFVEAFFKKTMVPQSTSLKPVSREEASIMMSETGPGIFPAEGGPVDLRRRSTFVGVASSGPMHRLSRVDTPERRASTAGPPSVTLTSLGPLARRFSIATPLGGTDKDFLDSPTPPAVSPVVSQRKMSSPTPKIPESFLTKKRVTQNKEKRDSL